MEPENGPLLLTVYRAENGDWFVSYDLRSPYPRDTRAYVAATGTTLPVDGFYDRFDKVVNLLVLQPTTRRLAKALRDDRWAAEAEIQRMERFRWGWLDNKPVTKMISKWIDECIDTHLLPAAERFWRQEANKNATAKYLAAHDLYERLMGLGLDLSARKRRTINKWLTHDAKVLGALKAQVERPKEYFLLNAAKQQLRLDEFDRIYEAAVDEAEKAESTEALDVLVANKFSQIFMHECEDDVIARCLRIANNERGHHEQKPTVPYDVAEEAEARLTSFKNRRFGKTLEDRFEIEYETIMARSDTLCGVARIAYLQSTVSDLRNMERSTFDEAEYRLHCANVERIQDQINKYREVGRGRTVERLIKKSQSNWRQPAPSLQEA
jgi:hypothetical protein